MNYNQWREKYKPVEFPDTESGHPYLLETFGWDTAHLKLADPRCVWTLIDGSDDDNTYIVNGFHHVNRIGHIITEVPFEGDFLEVLDD